MGKQEDLLAAENAIKSAEARVDYIEAHMLLLEIEIRDLHVMQDMLTENIKILKENKIVAKAKEYKKAKADLVKTKNLLKMSVDDHTVQSKSRQNAHTLLQKCREAYDIIKGRYQDNVVVGTFGRKNGGQR